MDLPDISNLSLDELIAAMEQLTSDLTSKTAALRGTPNNYLVVHGAHGRTYDSPEAAMASWQAGDDFQVLGEGLITCDTADAWIAKGYLGIDIVNIPPEMVIPAPQTLQ